MANEQVKFEQPTPATASFPILLAVAGRESRGGCLGACCTGSRRCHHQQDRWTADRNRFRCQSRLEKKTCLRNGFEKPSFGPWDFQVTAEKAMQSRTWLEDWKLSELFRRSKF